MDRRACALLGLASADVVAARQIVEVGLDDRERRVGRLKPSSVASCSALEPAAGTHGPSTQGASGFGWPPVASVNRRRTSAGRGPPKKRSCRRLGGGAPIAPSSSGGAGRPDAPRPGLVEAEVAGLGVVDQDAVAGGRQQPRDRVVGRVGAGAKPPRRDERLGERILLGLVRAVADVVLDDVSALVDRVRPFAEPEVAFAALGRQSRSRARRPGRRPTRRPERRARSPLPRSAASRPRSGGPPDRRWQARPNTGSDGSSLRSPRSPGARCPRSESRVPGPDPPRSPCGPARRTGSGPSDRAGPGLEASRRRSPSTPRRGSEPTVRRS